MQTIRDISYNCCRAYRTNIFKCTNHRINNDSQNLSAFLMWRKLATGLSRPAKNLHFSCHQCLRNNPLSAAPVKLSYASYESVKGNEKNQNAPIIIMHGLFGSKSNWNSLSTLIHRKTNRKVITIDARNHGESPHSSSMSYKDMAEDVIQLLNDLSFEKAILVGFSMGGSAMMYTALNFPQRVEKLAVVDMSPVRISPNFLVIKKIFEAMSLVTADGSSTLSEARKIVDQQLEKSIKSSALREYLITTNLVEVDLGKYKWRVNLPVLEKAFSTQIAVFPKVDSKIYRNPTLFICSTKSNFIRVEDHDAIKQLFPLAEFRYIDGADHWVHADKPIEFVHLLTNFINQPVL